MQPVLPCPFDFKDPEKYDKPENYILSILLKCPSFVPLICVGISAERVNGYPVPTGKKCCAYWLKKDLFHRHKRTEKECYEQKLCRAMKQDLCPLSLT